MTSGPAPPGGGASQRWATAVRAGSLPADTGDARAAEQRAQSLRDVAHAAGRDDPAVVTALDALPRHGAVLDVGCGGGARSVGLAGRAGLLTGVDPDHELLDAYRARLERPRMRMLGIGRTSVRTVHGTWPGSEGMVTTADVAVSGSVLYGVGDGVGPFLTSLTGHARHRVVLTLPERDPQAWLAPYLAVLHGARRRQHPRAGVLLDVLRELGITPRVVAWEEQQPHPTGEAMVVAVARWCGVGEERHEEVRDALWRRPPPTIRTLLAVSWDGAA